MEKTRPPRGLWVPFELGRPLGEPEDESFQHRVLAHALGLLTRTDGPLTLEDFPDDPPGWPDRAGWRPPMALPLPPSPPPDTAAAWQAALDAELALVRPYQEEARRRFGRSTVGLFRQPPTAWAAYAAPFLAGALPTAPDHATPALALRFLVDDLKAFYSEAAQARGLPPSSRQVDLWFWRETTAGQFLRALREAAMKSDNNALKTVGGRFFVPTHYLSV